jgi:membrane protein DedA with SNARE-associated domain
LGFINEIGIPDLFTIDLTLIFIGYNLGFSSGHVLLLMVALLVGQLLGATCIYLLSVGLGTRFSRWLCLKSPKFENKLIDLEGKLDEHATSALLFIRLGPGINTGASVAAGLANIQFRGFALGVGISAFIANSARFLAGYATYKGITILGIHPQTWQIVTGIIILLALFWMSAYLIKTKVEKRIAKPQVVVHSAHYSNRTCPLPPQKPMEKQLNATTPDHSPTVLPEQ